MTTYQAECRCCPDMSPEFRTNFALNVWLTWHAWRSPGCRNPRFPLWRLLSWFGGGR